MNVQYRYARGRRAGSKGKPPVKPRATQNTHERRATAVHFVSHAITHERNQTVHWNDDESVSLGPLLKENKFRVDHRLVWYHTSGTGREISANSFFSVSRNPRDAFTAYIYLDRRSLVLFFSSIRTCNEQAFQPAITWETIRKTSISRSKFSRSKN